MKKSRYTEEQIAYVLRQAESGTPVPDVCLACKHDLPATCPDSVDDAVRSQ